jgi:hypothetical protein
MSLRDRFRPELPAPGPDARAEARAAQALSARRGRATIAPPPRAAKSITALVRPFAKNAGLSLRELQRRWGEIAGESFARATPEKLAAGVLTLRAPGALAPFLQQQAPLLVERLKTAGAKVKAVRIEQRAAARLEPNVTPLKRPVTPEQEAALAQALDHVGDPALKSALMRLGRAVKQG